MIQTLFGSLEEEQKTGFLDRMKQAVTRTRENLAERIEQVVSIGKEIDRNTLDDLEATLISADLGMATTQQVLAALREKADRKQRLTMSSPFYNRDVSLFSKRHHPMGDRLPVIGASR